MKTYSAASSDLDDCIARMQRENHPDLDGVSIAALFVFDEESSDSVLKHQGYPAAAIVRITPVRDRKLGVADAVIVVDRSAWQLLVHTEKDALVDHELTHLTRAVDDETGIPKCDAVDRPKLRIRQHDHQFGWFDEIAQRHGDASPEKRQAKRLVDSTQQLYLDFSPRKPKSTEARAH